MKVSKKKIVRIIQSLTQKYFFNSFYKLVIFFRSFKNFQKKINAKKSFIKFSKTKDLINDYEYKVTSQNNEDGIISHIFNKIPNNKTFIELGFSFSEFNSLNLIRKKWEGKLIDYNIEEVVSLKMNLFFFFRNSKINIVNAKIFKENINDLIGNDLKTEIDFFSIDIDGNDYWILKQIDISNIKLICLEYNHWLGQKNIVMKYDKNFVFKDDGIFGASLLAYTALLKKKNFSLIAVESSGTNAFYINNKYANLFKILSPFESFKSIGRFYSEEKKNKIYLNISKSDKFITDEV